MLMTIIIVIKKTMSRLIGEQLNLNKQKICGLMWTERKNLLYVTDTQNSM